MDRQSSIFVLIILFKVLLLVAFAFGKSNDEFEKVIIAKSNYHCGKNRDIEKVKTSNTLVRLPPNTDALYSVNTERISPCTANQSCTTMTWRIIRNLEIYLNTHYFQTGLSGLIEFPNNLVIPGFNYLLHVSLKHPDGKLEKKTYNLTFEDNEDLNNLVLGELDLVVGNSHTAYRTMPLVVNAHFTWFIVTKEKKVDLKEKSSTLFLEPNSTVMDFQDKLVVYCQVINNDNGKIVVENFIEVEIVDPPVHQNLFEIYLPFAYTTIKTGSNILITPYIFGSIEENYKSEWVCLHEGFLTNACRNQIQEHLYLESGFNQEGNYTIIVTVTTGEVTKSATGLIMVSSESPSVDFEFSHSYTVEVTAIISDLRTYCTVQWLHSEDQQIDLLTLPGVSLTSYNVSSKDKTFLEELVEFGEVTVTKKFTVKLPTPSNTWKGLAAGYYYMNLSVSCPLIEEITDENVYREVPENFLSHHSQCQFFVPSQPNFSALEVFSEGNVAFLTEYTFSIESSDQSHLLFNFGFILNGVDVIFACGIDLRTAKTILPFNADAGVQTFIEFCDYLHICGRKLGPVVKPDLFNYTSESLILTQFKQRLIEEDYYNVFAFTFTTLYSVGYLNETGKYTDLFSQELLSELVRLVEDNDEENLHRFEEYLMMFFDHSPLSAEFTSYLSNISNKN